jgi:predicted short-subunit dehydrogenase-like oxidoreductase (DUF2520 family)
LPARSGLRLPRSGLVFLAVPDGVVPEVAARIAALGQDVGLSFVHLSGALRLTALQALSGHALGSFHPLQSFPSPRDPSAFRGITVGVNATTPSLRRRLAALARDLGARPRHVDDRSRALYHAAAVFASNYVLASVAEAVAILQAAGWPRAEAERSLQPLVEGAVASLRERGVVKALTGPIRRGDLDTVKAHLDALGGLGGDPKIEAVYRMLGLVTLGIANEAGLDKAAAGRTRRALTRHVAATRRSTRR